MKVWFNNVYNAWQAALGNYSFKRSIVVGAILMGCLVLIMPAFFGFLQSRNGVVLNDWLLNLLPAFNVSIPIFLLIWGMAFLAFCRFFLAPAIFLRFLFAYIFLTLIRAITLWLVVLNPPVGLVALSDSITHIFYGGKFITKDLFFSGHTATLVLITCCLPKKVDKIIGIVATILLAALLLVQHIHYTIDVLAAPFFAYICYLLSSMVTKTHRAIQ